MLIRGLQGIILILALLVSCEEPEPFKYDLELLYDTHWVNPKVEETNSEFGQVDLSSPVIFRENGWVEIGSGTEEYWEVYDETSLLLESHSQLWVFMELTPGKMRVEKYTFPETRFIVRCVYERKSGS